MQLDPRHLSQLATIVELGSFSEAAKRHGLAQSALSRNIKTLEEQVGAPVLVRARRGVRPTMLGATLSRYGEVIRAADTQATAAAQSITSHHADQLRVAATRLIAENLLIGTLADFIAARPGVTCHLQVGDVQELFEMVSVGSSDLAIGNFSSLGSRSDLYLRAVYEDRMVVLLCPGHPLLRVPDPSPSLLRTVRWVVPWRGSPLRWEVETTLQNLGLEAMDVACETTSVAAMLSIVRASDFAAMLPRLGVSSALRNGMVAEMRLAPFGRRGPVGILSQNAKRNSPVINGFCAMLEATIERERASDPTRRVDSPGRPPHSAAPRPPG